MSTCQEIVTLAAELLGVIEAGGVPDTADNSRILAQLLGYYQKLISSGAFGRLTDRIARNSPDTACENERIVHDGTVTVNLPDSYPAQYLVSEYGFEGLATDGNYIRPPMDLAIVSIVRTDTGVMKDYIYDNRVRKWCELTGLTANDYAPLSHRDPDGLASALARRCSHFFDRPLQEEASLRAVRFEEDLTHNWSQDGEFIEPGEYW